MPFAKERTQTRETHQMKMMTHAEYMQAIAQIYKDAKQATDQLAQASGDMLLAIQRDKMDRLNRLSSIYYAQTSPGRNRKRRAK